MDKSTVIAKLREHAPELNAAGIVHLGVHGSVARGDATPSSDVDLIAEFDQSKRLSLIGRVHLENLLADILGVKADLADRAMLRPEVLERARQESILVF
ncbi:MAG: nucleotidyltransferase domain-containing protein [Bryobacteraceae bacterium]